MMLMEWSLTFCTTEIQHAPWFVIQSLFITSVNAPPNYYQLKHFHQPAQLDKWRLNEYFWCIFKKLFLLFSDKNINNTFEIHFDNDFLIQRVTPIIPFNQPARFI